jgi:hypothetical protein
MMPGLAFLVVAPRTTVHRPMCTEPSEPSQTGSGFFVLAGSADGKNEGMWNQ